MLAGWCLPKQSPPHQQLSGLNTEGLLQCHPRSCPSLAQRRTKNTRVISHPNSHKNSWPSCLGSAACGQRPVEAPGSYNSFWSSWKIFLGSFLNPYTIYKTARLKVFYWLLDVPSVVFVSIFPYSKQKSTYTCCLCEVHSVLKEKKLPVQATF